MAERLPDGGLLIDREREIGFTFDGAPLTGYRGDTLASALLANDRVLVGRSFKYHRPRGIVASGPEEPNALMGVGTGARFEPNRRATTVELVEGMAAVSQNRWPSLERDVGAAAAWIAGRLPIFPAGFYYKTFLFPRVAWKRVYEPLIRRAAGLGRAPDRPDPDLYEHFHAHVDTLVVGGGIAGLCAARAAAEAGETVLLVEQAAHWGGRALADGARIDGVSGFDWVAAEVAALEAMPNVRMRARTVGAGVHDHGYAMLCERVSDDLSDRPTPGDGRPRQRLWRVRARRIVAATGAIERPLTFANNDLPGVMLASAVRDYVRLWGVLPGRRAAIYANNDDAYRTALVLHEVGARVQAVIDVRSRATGELPERVRALGIDVRTGAGVAEAIGGRRLTGIDVGAIDGASGAMIGRGERIACDVLAISGGWQPTVHLWSHCGGKLAWDEDRSCFVPDPARPPTGADGAGFVGCVGAAGGDMTTAAILPDASVEEPGEAPLEPHWFTPSRGRAAHGGRHFVDFQNDVTAADVRLAAREGYESVEHAKRYTTLGMATDQGKTSNVNGLALLAEALDAGIPEVGVTTFRPPYTPIPMGAIAGSARGPLFKAVRRTPMHDWHDRNGADWEPVGDWRRPFCYRRDGEDRGAAIAREVLGVRRRVGLLDASTLGKIVVKGRDAGRFLDLVYTNAMSSLEPGRCRYGLMCNENGFLFDDGVVARIGKDEFLCHTTSGGSDHVHAHFEEWLQTEWWDLRVWTANVTDQWAQIVVAGPGAREVLQDADADVDLSLPFMSCAEGAIAGLPARLFRISFSGELSFEIATPAGNGPALWQALLEAGGRHGIMPYGTEALHVMRAEKGFVMIGDETDGTVTPQDLNLGWAVSKKKADFIGKRAQERADLVRRGRKQLVGLLTEPPEAVLPDGAHAVEHVCKPPMRTIGHVTSSYFSPTLGHAIAMGLVEDGLSRQGEWLDFPLEGGRVMRARIVSPVFHDPEGTKRHA